MIFSLRTFFACSLTCLGMILVSSCSVPANLRNNHALSGQRTSIRGISTYEALEQALETPNQGESARALALFVSKWHEERPNSTRGVLALERCIGPLPKSYRVMFSKRNAGSFSPGYFDEISPAADYRVKKIDHHQREGVGAPLLAFRENQNRDPIEEFYPKEGISRDVTAVIHPGTLRGNVQEVRIELLSPLHYETVFLEGKTRPLAGDFSVSFAHLIGRSQDLNRSEIGDVFRPMPRFMPQLYMMEEYDRRKEPIIMIHGLLGSPLVWTKLSNDLRNEPDIRKNYQIWHFLYNSSAPALYSARFLRAQLREMRGQLDPDSNDPAMREITAIAHSMGGIVTRGLISDPGDIFWNQAFTRPIDRLNLENHEREKLRDAFFWKPDPSVKRVIFICTPHRGSIVADNPIGRLGKLIVQPPSQFKEFYCSISRRNPGAFTDLYTDLGSGQLNSVGALSPSQPTLKLLGKLPVPYPVTMHSIIADRGKKIPLEESTDGLVPYSSSHLDEAVSEKIVPSGHGAYDEPETIVEVIRILDSSH